MLEQMDQGQGRCLVCGDVWRESISSSQDVTGHTYGWHPRGASLYCDGGIVVPCLTLRFQLSAQGVPRPQGVCLLCPLPLMQMWRGLCYSSLPLMSLFPCFLVVICCGCGHVLKVMHRLEVNRCFFLLIILSKWVWREQGFRGFFFFPFLNFKI